MAWERGKGGRKIKKAERMRWRTSKKGEKKEKKPPMAGKETRKRERIGEAGQKIGKGGVKRRGGKHPQWGSIIPRVPGQGLHRAGEQPRRAAGSLRNLVC